MGVKQQLRVSGDLGDSYSEAKVGQLQSRERCSLCHWRMVHGTAWYRASGSRCGSTATPPAPERAPIQSARQPASADPLLCRQRSFEIALATTGTHRQCDEAAALFIQISSGKSQANAVLVRVLNVSVCIVQPYYELPVLEHRARGTGSIESNRESFPNLDPYNFAYPYR